MILSFTHRKAVLETMAYHFRKEAWLHHPQERAVPGMLLQTDLIRSILHCNASDSSKSDLWLEGGWVASHAVYTSSASALFSNTSDAALAELQFSQMPPNWLPHLLPYHPSWRQGEALITLFLWQFHSNIIDWTKWSPNVTTWYSKPFKLATITLYNIASIIPVMLLRLQSLASTRS